MTNESMSGFIFLPLRARQEPAKRFIERSRQASPMPTRAGQRTRPDPRSFQETLTKFNELAATIRGRQEAEMPTPTDQLMSMAESRVASGRAKSLSEAMDAVVRENPDLFDQHRKASSDRSMPEPTVSKVFTGQASVGREPKPVSRFREAVEQRMTEYRISFGEAARQIEAEQPEVFRAYHEAARRR